jgi:hypothetical protein
LGWRKRFLGCDGAKDTSVERRWLEQAFRPALNPPHHLVIATGLIAQ